MTGKRNPLAKELADAKYSQRVRAPKRSHLIDVLHEQDAEEDLYDFFHNLGLGTKE